VDESVVQAGLCVDWHTPGPSGIAAPGEMWRGYPQSVRPEIRAITGDYGVIPVLPITTTETGLLLYKRTKRVEDVSGETGGAVP
jgi:hypothetical protein